MAYVDRDRLQGRPKEKGRYHEFWLRVKYSTRCVKTKGNVERKAKMAHGIMNVRQIVKDSSVRK